MADELTQGVKDAQARFDAGMGADGDASPYPMLAELRARRCSCRFRCGSSRRSSDCPNPIFRSSTGWPSSCWDSTRIWTPHCGPRRSCVSTSRERKPHIGFGHGAHVCLGMHLARLESTAIFEALLDRLPRLRLDPETPEPYVAGTFFRSPPHLEVVWDR